MDDKKEIIDPVNWLEVLYPDVFAANILSVQQLESNVALFNPSVKVTEKELINANYGPISNIGLLWVKR